MRCFNHSENRAVGLCKWCLKGICPECLVDLGDGLACNSTCKDHVVALNESQVKIYNAKRMMKGNPIYSFLLMSVGSLLILYSLIGWAEKSWQITAGCNLFLGLIFIFIGISGFKYRSQSKGK